MGDTKKAIEQLEWVLRDDLPLLNGDLLREASVMLAKSYYAVAMRDRAEYALELMLEKQSRARRCHGREYFVSS